MISILPFLAAPIVASPTMFVSGITCPQITPQITMQQQTRPLEFVGHLSAASLTNMQKRKGMVPHSSTSFVQGLGGGSITLTGNVTFSIYGDDVERCLTLKSIEGEMISAPLVHIARNYQEGTCEYNAVLEHEMKHVKVLNEFRAEYAPKFQAELERLASLAHPVGPLKRAYIKPTQARKHGIIEGGIKRYADEITEIMQRRQLAIDSTEEYARTHGQCDNWNDAALSADTYDAPHHSHWYKSKPVYNVLEDQPVQDGTSSLYERYPPQIPSHRRKSYNQ